MTVAATVCSEHTFPAAIQSEAPSGEPNNTTDQATKSTSEKEPCEHQPVTDNDLQEPLLLYDQIVAGEVTVAATVCSEHTLPAAIQSEAPSGEPNSTTDQATKSTSEKEPCEYQPVTDNDIQELLLLYDQIVAGEVTVAATVCSEHTLPAAIQSEAPSGEPNNTTDQATKSTSEKEPCENQPVTGNNLQEPLLLYDQIVAGEVTVAATVCSELTLPAAIQSEAPSGEPNNTTDQATKSASEKEPCEHQPVTGNNLQEPLLLYDQIVAGEVTVAATVCSEHTLPAAIQSEASQPERVTSRSHCLFRTYTTCCHSIRSSQPHRLPSNMLPPSSVMILIYWCCSVTMQIDRRINSTTDQREEERKVKSVGHPFSAAGIGFRSVPLTAVCSRIGWMRHYVAIVWHRKGSWSAEVEHCADFQANILSSMR